MRRKSDEFFLGTKPRGEVTKLGKGGSEKGPAIRPSEISLDSNEAT